MLCVERTDSPYLRIRASGLLIADDYDRFEPEFADELGHWNPPVPLLLDMRGFRGWSPRGFFRDLLWDYRNRKTFWKIAVIGDAGWHRWLTRAGALLFRGELNYFSAEEANAAEQSLRERDRRFTAKYP